MSAPTSHRPSLTAHVVRLSTGDYNPCLVTRRGRIVWQGSCHDNVSSALAQAESERTARYIRAVLRAELRVEASA